MKDSKGLPLSPAAPGNCGLRFPYATAEFLGILRVLSFRWQNSEQVRHLTSFPILSLRLAFKKREPSALHVVLCRQEVNDAGEFSTQGKYGASVPMLSCDHMGACLGPVRAQPSGADICVPDANVYDNQFHCTVLEPEYNS